MIILFFYGQSVIYQLLASTLPIYYKEKLCQMWLGFRPFVLVFTPDEVEVSVFINYHQDDWVILLWLCKQVILSSNYLTDKAPEYNFLEPWLGQGLVTSNGAKWKAHRKILTPAFHFRILQDFLPIINENAIILVKKLHRLSSQELEISSIITLCTLDVICETAMGIKVNCQENESEYAKCIKELSETVLFRISRPWLWFNPIFFLSKQGRDFKSNLKKIKQFTENVIKERMQKWDEKQMNMSNVFSDDSSTMLPDTDEKGSTILNNRYTKSNKRLAFLDLLLDLHMNNKSLTFNDIKDEVETFMFAVSDWNEFANLSYL